MKKYFWWMLSGGLVFAILMFLLGRFVFPNNGLPGLPLPELSEGQRGELGIDKNINEKTIDSYLGRSDAVYRDMRMLKDPGDYQSVGGDSYLSGFVKGFEVVPFPYIVNVTGLPESVGDTYKGKTLYTEKNGKYTQNYAESIDILEALFPRDKVIFLMCGGGGYSGMMKNLLVALGWDTNKIYDVGGYWFYEGKNKVTVKRTNADGKEVYDFYKVPYHEIEFDNLTPVELGDIVDITAEDYEKMIENRRSFMLVVDQTACVTSVNLRRFVRLDLKNKDQIGYRIMYEELEKTSLWEKVDFYPSVVVIEKGRVVQFLRTDADEDAAAFNSYEEFSKWLGEDPYENE